MKKKKNGLYFCGYIVLFSFLNACTFSKIELHELQGCTCNIDTKVIADPVVDPDIQTSGLKTNPEKPQILPK